MKQSSILFPSSCAENDRTGENGMIDLKNLINTITKGKSGSIGSSQNRKQIEREQLNRWNQLKLLLRLDSDAKQWLTRDPPEQENDQDNQTPYPDPEQLLRLLDEFIPPSLTTTAPVDDVDVDGLCVEKLNNSQSVAAPSLCCQKQTFDYGGISLLNLDLLHEHPNRTDLSLSPSPRTESLSSWSTSATGLQPTGQFMTSNVYSGMDVGYHSTLNMSSPELSTKEYSHQGYMQSYDDWNIDNDECCTALHQCNCATASPTLFTVPTQTQDKVTRFQESCWRSLSCQRIGKSGSSPTELRPSEGILPNNSADIDSLTLAASLLDILRSPREVTLQSIFSLQL